MKDSQVVSMLHPPADFNAPSAESECSGRPQAGHATPLPHCIRAALL
jgi:hypothetical protein